MPSINLKLTARIHELLEAGVITITADLHSSGNDIYGRVVQPHPKLGVYPHQSMNLEELENSLEKIQVPEVRMVAPSDSPMGKKKGQAMSVLYTYDPVVGKVPVEMRVNGVMNKLSNKSLTWRDLAYLSDDQLQRRLLYLGKEMGADKAVSKITSGPTLNTVRAPKLSEWWRKASEYQRWTLMTNSKLVGKCPSDEAQLLARLGPGNYPFRGIDQTVEAHKEETDEEESFSELEARYGGLTIQHSEGDESEREHY
jgi:hypothetical protein